MSLTSQESSLESDSKLSTAGETVDSKPRPQPVDTQSPPDVKIVDVAIVDVIVTKSNVQTQTVVEKQEAVETYQQLNPVPGTDKRQVNEPVAVDSIVTKSLPQETKKEKKVPLVNGSSFIDVKEIKESGNEFVNQPKLDGSVNGKGYLNKEIVTGEKLVNGYDGKSKVEKKTDKKGKKLNGLTNGIVEKPRDAIENHIEGKDDFVFQDDGFLYTQEFINGNISVDLDEESEWITVKGHKGSQGKRSDSARVNEEKKFPSELTNGHLKSNRDNGHKVNGVGGKDKIFHKNNSDKFKTDKTYVNGKVEEKCTYTKVKQNESISKEKTVNGKGKLVNGNKMDGNEKEIPFKGKEIESGNGDTKLVSCNEMSGSSDVPKKSIQQVEETAPMKPSRKERKSLKNGSPPKTPESTLTATAKPFEMPSVSLRPETFVKQTSTSTTSSDYLSREDSLLAALTVERKETKSMEDIAKDIKSSLKQVLAGSSKDVTAVTEATKKPISSTEQKYRGRDEPKGSSGTSKVTPLKDLASKSIGKDQMSAGTNQQVQDDLQMASSMVALDVKSMKDLSKDFLVRESQNLSKNVSVGVEDLLRGSKVCGGIKKNEAEKFVVKDEERNEMDSDREMSPPVPPPRRKKTRQNKRATNERVPSVDATLESTDESSSSSSQESEESVIECLSSGFNSPKTKIVPELSDEDEEIIFQGKLGQKEPKPLGRISESLEETSTVQNGKSSIKNGGAKPALPQPKATTSKSTSKEKPKSLPQKSVQTSKSKERKDKFSDTYKSEEHLKNVQIMAKEIVDSVVDEAMQESVRLKYQIDSDPSKLGITDAVTRWLRSQSPDVLSVPINDDSESEISEELEEDVEDEMTTGSKNLKSNPLPAPSVEELKNQLNIDDSIGVGDIGRRVANKSSVKKDLKDMRINTPDMEDDAVSNDSIPCGEWDLWDCQQTIAQNYDEILDKSNKKQTKNTNGINIISPEITVINSPIFIHKSVPLVHEYVNLPDGQHKYDPLANDTFSPVENTLLNEIMDSTSPTPDRCTNMCDPALSVAKYYILGPNPRRTLSSVDDLDCSDSDDSSLTKHNDEEGGTYRMSLAEELARLNQPLPASWAVEPIRIEKTTKPKRCATCHCNGQDCGAPVDSGVESGDEATVTRKRESMSVFKRKLVGRLKGEGTPFPCGGICCILQ